MTLWAIRHKKTGLFYDGGRKFVETPVNKLYRKEGHAKAALTQFLFWNNYSKSFQVSHLDVEIVELKVEVVENAELV